MKIAVIVDNEISSGGGFNQAINAIRDVISLQQQGIEVLVFTSNRANTPYLKMFGIDVVEFSFGTRDRLVALAALSSGLGRLQSRLKLTGNLDHSLEYAGVDLAYFVEPTWKCLSLARTNFIATLWDLSHRDNPEFPEVREFGELLHREQLYRNMLAEAFLVVIDSTTTKDRIIARYGMDEDRLLVIPFSPSPFLKTDGSRCVSVVLREYDLVPGYYFYPAQFWPHKNHVRILQALRELKGHGIMRQMVFAGGDKGNLSHVRNLARDLGVEMLVRFLGFVPADDVRGLYEGCSAVIMPTYFGPTNIPPLEAWMFDKPLVYSAHLAEQVGDAALLVDPDDSAALAKAMKEVVDAKMADELVRRGRLRLREIADMRMTAHQTLLQRILLFSKRRECWGR